MRNKNKVDLENAVMINPKQPVTLQALGEYVLLKEPKDIDQIGSIVLPSGQKSIKVPNVAEVVSKGEQCSLHFKVGDVVVFAAQSGDIVEHNGETYRIMGYHGIQAVVRKA